MHAQAVTNVPAGGLPSANEFSAQILPERAGVVSWRTLAQVQPVKQGGKMVPEFSKDILALDTKETRVQGFMIPLDVGDKQKRFLLTAVPPHCSFCLPAGPDAVVEIVAKTPVRYTFDPIVVSGKFAVLRNDAAGAALPPLGRNAGRGRAARARRAPRAWSRAPRRPPRRPRPRRPAADARRCALATGEVTAALAPRAAGCALPRVARRTSRPSRNLGPSM